MRRGSRDRRQAQLCHSPAAASRSVTNARPDLTQTAADMAPVPSPSVLGWRGNPHRAGCSGRFRTRDRPMSNQHILGSAEASVEGSANGPRRAAVRSMCRSDGPSQQCGGDTTLASSAPTSSAVAACGGLAKLTAKLLDASLTSSAGINGSPADDRPVSVGPRAAADGTSFTPRWAPLVSVAAARPEGGARPRGDESDGVLRRAG